MSHQAIQLPTGAKAALDALASSSSLIAGALVYLTDQQRVAVQTGNGSYAMLGRSTEAVPAGGTTGQVLTKTSNSDHALAWETPSGSVTPAALSRTNDTNVTITLGGTPSTALLQATSITVGWSGSLAVSRGGTGSTTASGARTNLGLGTSDSPQFGGLTISAADPVLAIRDSNTSGTSCTGALNFADSGGTTRGRVTKSASGAMWLESDGGAVYLSNQLGTAKIIVDAGIYPNSDNVGQCGASGYRWSVVWAATGTISTSDAREKTKIRPLDERELAAAIDLAREIGTFRFLSEIRKKAAQRRKARRHAGMTVQRAIEIMKGHGLEPFDYGFICHDKWEARRAPRSDGRKGRLIPAGDRYSFRVDELLLFIARGFDARLARLEALAVRP